MYAVVFERTLLHLRKSRADLEAESRGEGETLAKHERFLLKFAKENNINIINRRRELESGEFLIHRPDMLKTLSEVEQGMYDAVLCMDIDRLGRGKKQDQGIILETFKNSNTKIITPRKTYDLSDEWDEEYVDFEQFMAHKELRYINRRLQRGRIGSIESGNYLGTNPPYGYLIKSEGKGNRYLIPHPEQAPIVRMIFERYTHDDSERKMGSNKIANELNRLGHRSAKDKPWEPSSVLFILKNAVYAGRIQWKKKDIKKSLDPDKKKDTRTRPQNEWIDVQGKHEPLIPMDVFLKAQEILKGRYHVPYQIENKITNPLAGLIRCDMCGASMVLRPYSHQKYSHIMCYSSKCPNKSARFIYVEEKLIEGIRLWLHQYKVEWESQKKVEKGINPFEFLEKSLSKLNKEISDINEQKGRLHDLLEKGIYSTEIFLERSQVMAERLRAIRQSISETQNQIDKEKVAKKPYNEIIPMLENVVDIYYKTDEPAERNNLIKTVISYATYRKEKHQRDDDFSLILHLKLPQINSYEEAQKK